jgi:hypothetical protein
MFMLIELELELHGSLILMLVIATLDWASLAFKTQAGLICDKIIAFTIEERLVFFSGIGTYTYLPYT